jgi:ribosomal protein S18 acetylase RimI-like enzyme
MTTQQVTIVPAAIVPAVDQDRAIAVITMAFSADPIVRWFIRDAGRYLRYFPPFVAAMGGGAFAQGTADVVDDFAGVALWHPPDSAPDEERMGALAAEAIPEAEQEERFAFMEQMGDYHPTEPHWYLPLVGVDTNQRGRGYGAALLRHALARTDRDRLPAYLEATSPLNKALYERHGFEAIGVIQSGSSPPMWPMLRKPR